MRLARPEMRVPVQEALVVPQEGEHAFQFARAVLRHQWKTGRLTPSVVPNQNYQVKVRVPRR